MIDLHTHTNYSDGTWEVSKLLEEAEKTGIEVLSITDHDTVKEYKELIGKGYNSLYKGKIIPGVELNTVFDGVKFELLAYDFDLEKLDKWIYENYETKKPNLNKEFELMVESCKRNNIKIGDINYDVSEGIWPIDIIFPEIKKYEENKKYFSEEEWNNIDKFFNSCVTKKDFPVFVDFSIHYPKAEEVSNAVREAGGKLFVAHAYRYALDDTIGFIDKLAINKLIDGVEVYHSSFTDDQVYTLKEYCNKNQLLISGGTDCHGDKKANRKIGVGYGNMNINKNILNNWNI